MLIEEAVDRADELYPNPYQRTQKLAWCHDVSENIRATIKRLFSAVEFAYTGQLALPDGVSFDEVESVFINGVKADKVDERVFTGGTLKDEDSIRIVYRLRPSDYCLRLSGTFEFQTDNGVTQIRYPEAAQAIGLLAVGNEITIADSGSLYTGAVMDASDGNSISVRFEQAPADGLREAVLSSREHTLAATECPPPYDVLYIDYLCAQAAFYQNDLYDYNKFVTAYNEKLKGYASYYKQTNPIPHHKQFRNLW